jgi:hypothetical protein
MALRFVLALRILKVVGVSAIFLFSAIALFLWAIGADVHWGFR